MTRPTWQDWPGNPTPPAPEGTPVQVEHRNGTRHDAVVGRTHASHWDHINDGSDIVRYRLRGSGEQLGLEPEHTAFWRAAYLAALQGVLSTNPDMSAALVAEEAARLADASLIVSRSRGRL